MQSFDSAREMIMAQRGELLDLPIFSEHLKTLECFLLTIHPLSPQPPKFAEFLLIVKFR